MPITARSITDAVRNHAAKPTELVAATYDGIDQTDGELRAFLELIRDYAFAQSERLERDLEAEEFVGPLAGVPVAIKDNLCTREGHTTCASKYLKAYRSPFAATTARRLEGAGAIVVGKTNLDEFAMGSSGENSAVAPTRNPWDLERVPGGSSSGSAVAVASRMTPVALGSDTGGSIRQPAAFCGIVGLKPTYGLVSRYGLVAYASSLDQIGPFATNVHDAAALLGVIAGHDSQDATSVNQPVPNYAAALTDDALDARSASLRIGIPSEYFGEGLQPSVKSAIESAISQLGEAGARTVELSLPHTQYCVPTYYLIATAEASSNLARYDGVHYGTRPEGASDIAELYSQARAAGLGEEVKRRLMLGAFALSSGYHDAYYERALKVRRRIREDFDAAFEQVDVIVGPTTPTTAFELGAKTSEPLEMYLADVYTVAANLAGIPAISVPCGFDEHGLPIGLQLMARPFAEETLLQAAGIYERLNPWSQRVPPVAATLNLNIDAK